VVALNAQLGDVVDGFLLDAKSAREKVSIGTEVAVVDARNRGWLAFRRTKKKKKQDNLPENSVESHLELARRASVSRSQTDWLDPFLCHFRSIVVHISGRIGTSIVYL